MKVFPLLDKLRIEVMCDVSCTQYGPLLESYESLLHRLNEHIDAAHEVMRALRPPSQKEHLTHLGFLTETKLPGFTSFQDVVHKGYRDLHIGLTVNELKHSSAQLRAICGTTESRVVLGYFLDGAHSADTIGPNRRLHRRYGHLETAFSFSRDMLMHFWWLYRISESLCGCIEQTMKADHNVKLRETAAPNRNPEWQALCIECARLDPAFFLDECEKPYPIVVCPADASSLQLRFPTLRRATSYNTMRIRVLFNVSEQSRGLTMPYFQKEPHKQTRLR